MRLFLVCVVLFPLAWGCVSPPRQELSAARSAIEDARNVQADVYAAGAYEAANTAFRNAEKLIEEGDYERARELLRLVESQARTSYSKALEEKAGIEKKAISEPKKTGPQKPARTKTVKTKTPDVSPPPPAPHQLPPTPPPPITHYEVVNGETLWTISALQEVYNDPLLWPLLYKANRDQISDPRTIYPGQVLSIPRKLSENEINDAREQARQSDIFPVEILQKKQDAVQPQ